MADKQVSIWQFSVGIAATIIVSVLASALSYCGTKDQIRAQRGENQRVHDSQLLKEISVAVSVVRQQLMAHAGALMELEGCLSQRNASIQLCRGKLDSFDAGKLVEAWTNLDGTLRAATPFLTSAKESPLLDKLSKLKKAHALSVDPLLPANSAESAAAIQAKTKTTMDSLTDIEDKLLTAVAERARAQ
jgi:hypothetical protein